MTRDEYLALRVRFGAKRRAAPAADESAAAEVPTACAACGRAICAHPDPVYAGLFPLSHGQPLGRIRAPGTETANAAGAGQPLAIGRLPCGRGDDASPSPSIIPTPFALANHGPVDTAAPGEMQ